MRLFGRRWVPPRLGRSNGPGGVPRQTYRTASDPGTIGQCLADAPSGRSVGVLRLWARACRLAPVGTVQHQR